MTDVVDRYEGQCAGTCGCGHALIWVHDARGQWVTTHESLDSALSCARMAQAVA